MNFNLNAFGTHPDSAENRKFIKDVDFLGQIDELLAGNPTDEQLEEVRKTLFGTNKAWVPRLLLDDLTNSPLVPPTPVPPTPVGPEPWPNRVQPSYVEPTEYDHYRIEFDIENDEQEITLFTKFSGQFAWIPSQLIMDGESVDLMESYELSSGSHILEIYDDPNRLEYYHFHPSVLSSDFAQVIRKLYIPNYITQILNWYLIANLNFLNLTELHIPSSVTYIDSHVFANSNLSQLYISASGDELEIGEESFRGCGLTSVYIPDRVTRIGQYAFSMCSELYDVRMPNIAEFVFGDYIFYGCQNLKRIYFGDAWIRISYGICNQCFLQYIYIPETVVSIDGQAFSENTSTQYIFVECITPPSLGDDVFGNTGDCPIYVPDKSVEAYKTANGWSEYADRIHSIYDYTGPSNIDEI